MATAPSRGAFRSPSPAFAARRLARWAAVLFLSLAIAVQPAAAQSILRDAETERLLHDLAEPLVRAAGLEPGNFEIVLLHENSINAFVAGGQRVYLHSGLLSAADDVNEVQGVIAHEIGHITGGHIIRFDEGMKAATGITLLSLLLGAAAIAAGAGDAGAGIMAAGQQAALGKFLAFSRVQERSADAAGAQFLSDAGISGKGSIDFFKKLQNYEFRLGIPQEDSYGRTHPLSGERISVLQDAYSRDPAWERESDPDLQRRFDRVKAKLQGYIGDPRATLREYPESDQSVPARYARTYAWHRTAYPKRALHEAEQLVQSDPTDPYFLEIYGQILLESGRPEDALPALRKAVEITNTEPLIASLFGHALVATEDEANYDEAERVLRAAVAKDRRNPFAWYQLGIIYEQRGDRPRASLASAERYMLQGAPPLALRNAKVALVGLPAGSPDWIRAQDIELSAQAAIEQRGARRRR